MAHSVTPVPSSLFHTTAVHIVSVLKSKSGFAWDDEDGMGVTGIRLGLRTTKRYEVLHENVTLIVEAKRGRT